MMDGLLIIDKPEGMTSAEVVRIIKGRLGCKTGHLGTLDPFASGVLPLCLDEGTKIAQFLNGADKGYEGLIRMGSETDSGDFTGKIVRTAAIPSLEGSLLSQVAERFQGERLQTPPMYSAVKRRGTPLYKLARQGIEVERKARTIRIGELHLFQEAHDLIRFAVACSKGTYVRVLAQEISVALGSVGHLARLRRTRFGRFTLADAVSIGTLGSARPPVIGLRESLRHLKEIHIDAVAAGRARQGYEPLLESITEGAENESAMLVGPSGDLAAVICRQRGRWRFARVFGNRGEPRA